MSDTHEEWRVIQETDGKYSVSDKGRVKNNRTGYVLKPIKWTKGYMKVNLHMPNGIRISRQIHRLVATAFIPNPGNKPEVNHKNGIHDDNRLSNLEWMTGEENLRHAYDTGLVKHKDERLTGYLYHFWTVKHKQLMCEEWQEYLRFYEWCYDNGYSDGMFVCRHNTESFFGPDNCFINSKKERPKIPKAKRKRLFDCFGELLTVEEVSVRYNIGAETFMYRLHKGMSVEDAATKPLVKSGRPRKEVV